MVFRPIILCLWVIKVKVAILAWENETADGQPFLIVDSQTPEKDVPFLHLHSHSAPLGSAHIMSHLCPQLAINQGASWQQTVTDRFPSKVLHLSWNLFKTHFAQFIYILLCERFSPGMNSDL